MKSVISKSCCEKKEKPFPKLMCSTDNKDYIVLFTREKEGTVVSRGGGYRKLGEHRSDWITRCFEDYEGDVCLTND